MIFMVFEFIYFFYGFLWFYLLDQKYSKNNSYCEILLKFKIPVVYLNIF